MIIVKAMYDNRIVVENFENMLDAIYFVKYHYTFTGAKCYMKTIK